MDDIEVPWSNTLKYLGFYLDHKGTPKTHIDKTLSKVDTVIKCIYPFIHRDSSLNVDVKLIIYKLYIKPLLLYAFPITATASTYQLKRLQTKENKILRLLLNKPFDYSRHKLYKEAKILPVTDTILSSNRAFLSSCRNSSSEILNIL